MICNGTQAEQAKREAREAQMNGKTELNGKDSMEDDDLEDEDDAPEASTSAAAAPRQFRGTLSDFYSNLSDEKSEPRVVAVVLLLDARDPASWRVSDLERKVRNSNSKLTIAMTKVDLVPLEIVAAWIAHLSKVIESPVFPICSPEPGKNGIKARAGGGIVHLVAHLESQLKAKSKANSDAEEEAIAIVGIENSGKTTLANILAPSLPNFSIVDTPPIVAAFSKQAHLSAKEEEEDNEEEDEEILRLRDKEAAHRILIRNSGSVFKVREPMPLIDSLMERVSQVSDLMMSFNVPAFATTNDFLIGVARTQGRLKKGAVPDTIAASRHILRGWSTGELGYYSKPPAGIEGVEESRRAIAKDASLKGLVLSRKEWRQAWNGKELRLTTGDDGLLASVKVAFAKPVDIEEAEYVDAELDDDEEVDVNEEVDEDEDEDEE